MTIEKDSERWYEIQAWANRRIAKLGLGDTLALFSERWGDVSYIVNASGRKILTEQGIPEVAVPELIRRLERSLWDLLHG